MPAPQAIRAPRRALVVAVTAAVLAAGGAGMAYATAGPDPVETGYAVVDTAGTTPETAPESGATERDRECDELKNRGRNGSEAPESSPAPSSPGSSAGDEL